MKLAIDIIKLTLNMAVLLSLTVIGIPVAVVVVLMGLCLAFVVAVLGAAPLLFVLIGLLLV